MGIEEQQNVSEFIESNGLEAPPAFRLLDAVSELGEVAKDAAESTGYGEDPDLIVIERDELGDVLFSVLVLAESPDVDAGEALEGALAKYDERLAEGDTPTSGR